MDRDRIKIREFGEQEESAAAGRAGTKADGRIKVKTFDDDGRKQSPRRRVATPESVGPVKIKQFDGPAARDRAAKPEQTAARAALPRADKIKIVEFDKEKPAKAAGTRRDGIKVVEFD